MRRRRFLLALAAGTTVAGAAAAQGRGRPWAGVVTAMVGSRDDAMVWRGGQYPYPLGLLTPIFDGDVVRVIGERATVVVATADGARRSITARSGPVRFAAPGDQPSWWRNSFVVAVGDRLRRRQDNPSAPLVFRGGDDGPLVLTPSDLRDGRARVRTGRRSIAVAWRGGLAPFRVTIVGPDGAPHLDERNIPTRLLVVRRGPVIAPGEHRLTVTDAAGAVVGARFQAGPPDDVGVSGPDPAAAMSQAIEQAMSFAQAAPPRPFEALLTLAPFIDQNDDFVPLIDLLAD